jgi:glycyl-tRNA synthetase beta chain
MADLLYEIGTEEIPAGYIAPALQQLEAAMTRELEAARLTHGHVLTAATPRRLTIWVADIAERQPDIEEDVLGPPVRAAFDKEGKPTKAAEGFARSQGIEVARIERRETPRGEYCAVRRKLEGRPTAQVLAELLPRITLDISFPKSMTWISGDRSFARPVRRLTALFDKDVVPFTLLGVTSGRTVEGHPILSPGDIVLEDAGFDHYKAALKERMIMVDIAERKALIRKEIESALASFGGDFREEALLDEVTNLVQLPSLTVGAFDPAFLSVPAPVIEAAMMEHQRYFPVRDAQGRLAPRFLFVSDRPHDHEALIRVGNEQVLRARLADAQFFYEKDRKEPLVNRVEKLEGVSFLKGLGTYLDKARRLERLAAEIAGSLGLDHEASRHAQRAAILCKADLLTEMVGEFPGLQGEVGRIYARADGEPEQVATAIVEHYMPKSADGVLPSTPVGAALSLAEKLDNLMSCFAAGLVPSGSQDPYALRRQSQGALRIIERTGRHLSIEFLLRKALELLPEPYRGKSDAIVALTGFLKDRVFQMALDRGFPHDLIRAALSIGCNDICDFWARLDALRELSGDACWQELVITVERTYNIGKNAPVAGAVDPALFAEPLEKQVWELLQESASEIQGLEQSRDYVGAGRRYAEVFAAPLHEFFDKVFVNVEDEGVRRNRLLLMREVNRLFSTRVADLSDITTGTVR